MPIYKKRHPSVALAWLVCAFLLSVPIIAGCTPRSGENAAPALAQEATATPSVAEMATPAPAEDTPTSEPEAPPTLEPTIAPADVTATAAARPTPTGEPPADPVALLNVFDFYTTAETLVKRDRLDLDGQEPDETLLTIAGLGETITSEVESTLSVVEYDPKFREWTQVWTSEPISGTASPLPVVNPINPLGYNGKELLRDGSHIFVLRTTTKDGRARLGMWRWNAASNSGELLKAAPAGGGAEGRAVFEADLDLNVIDLDDDGIYEVIADNLTGVQIWKWDGSRYAPQAGAGEGGR